ncbi:hypothetical protein [Holospora curviuscula]|uniref:Uncharacterized protein n=1 Tax=Holospora curviuscula TaxID=1082868 RepID=A0A2S5RIB2_9PROT|nr:hypothetical protein [Holospora curviuscula]PPE06905.1 hypothetical protein HCUR_00056 [Holospora curviuscula]
MLQSSLGEAFYDRTASQWDIFNREGSYQILYALWFNPKHAEKEERYFFNPPLSVTASIFLSGEMHPRSKVYGPLNRRLCHLSMNEGIGIAFMMFRTKGLFCVDSSEITAQRYHCEVDKMIKARFTGLWANWLYPIEKKNQFIFEDPLTRIVGKKRRCLRRNVQCVEPTISQIDNFFLALKKTHQQYLEKCYAEQL